MKDTNFSIAVIVVCRNALPALRDTLASVESANDERVRLIVIDGASTDGTAALLESMRHRLFHWRSEPDLGIYDAMNKGWSAAPNDAYVLYLGAGDLLRSLPTDASLQTDSLEPRRVVLGETNVGHFAFRSRWSSELRLRNTAHHQALMVRKETWPEPPFDAGLRVYGDWDFNLRLFRRGVKAHHVDRFLTFAAPGGASWAIDTAEIFLVSARHSGPVVGAASWLLNSLSRWRRFARGKRQRNVDGY
jgi:glycosyltransferase involved in cell wall biosynthesis